MELSETITKQSETQPGVSFTIKHIGLARRTRMELSTTKFRDQRRELFIINKELFEWRSAALKEYTAAKKALDEATDESRSSAQTALESCAIALQPADKEAAVDAMNEALKLIDRQIEMAWIQDSLVSIDGLTVAGKPITTEQLLDMGPQALTDEISKAISNEAYLSADEAKNSQRPSTSPAAVDGPIPDTTATDASAQVTT